MWTSAAAAESLILSNRGEIYFLNHGERVLVKNPE